MMLVLEPANLHRLKNGDPVLVHVEDFFPDGIPATLELMVAYSETPHADAKEFVKMSKMTLDEKTPKLQAQRPHCPQCRSTIEQVGKFGQSGFPMTIFFCPLCGCTMGIHYDPPPKPKPTTGPEGLPQRQM